jgi:hypothetical protein
MSLPSDTRPAPRSNLINHIKFSPGNPYLSHVTLGHAPRVNVRMIRLFDAGTHTPEPEPDSRSSKRVLECPRSLGTVGKLSKTSSVTSISIFTYNLYPSVSQYKHRHVLRQNPSVHQIPPHPPQICPQIPLPTPPINHSPPNLPLPPLTPKCPRHRRFLHRLMASSQTHRVPTFWIQSDSRREKLSFQLHFQLPSIFGTPRS